MNRKLALALTWILSALTLALYTPERAAAADGDENWFTLCPSIAGVGGSVQVAVVDGLGNLYVGGGFTVAGDVQANHIAMWDGTRWHPLGSGVNGWVRALAFLGNDLYVGGDFTTAGGITANGIAKWDGSTWSALGSGVSGPFPDTCVNALAVSGSDVYAGGIFTNAGGIAANSVAKWNGSSWSALGSGVDKINTSVLGVVRALAYSDGNLYVGGNFNRAGGIIMANGIAKWNGSGWSILSGGGGDVFALAVSGNDVYAAGRLTCAVNPPPHYIAKWNGSTWSALGSEMFGPYDLYCPVSALAVSGGDLYAGGLFVFVGRTRVNNIAKWDGTSWSALGPGQGNSTGTFSPVTALAVYGSNLYAGVETGPATGGAVANIARWDGNNWSALGSGMNCYVHTLAASGNDVYAAGWFEAAGDTSANHIAKWDGTSWSALGSGLNNMVQALAVSGGDLYAGGRFTTAGGVPADCIAKWDGNSWSGLGEGVNYDVNALAASGSNLYVGGSFWLAGTNEAQHIAKWDGSNWSPLGAGANSYVYALAVSGTDVYAGGDFTMAGGILANHIARWDGNSWSALGAGVDGTVNALAVSGGDVYAGGTFTNAGGNVASYVAKWDGKNWSSLGSGLSAGVLALAVSGGNLYAGGRFTNAGGGEARFLAKWDGSRWSPLGSGMNSNVYALVVSGDRLYAGGWFTIAGGKVAGYVAGAVLNGGQWLPLQIGVPGPRTNTLTFTGIPNTPYRLLFSTNLTSGPWSPLATNTPAANGLVTVQDTTATNAHRFYRLGTP